MRIINILVLLFSITSYGQLIKYLPEEREYVSHTDIGYEQYATPSQFYTKKFVLTYDDGPHLDRTPRILDLLKRYKQKATFFIVTSRLNEKTRPIAIRAIKEGHIVASHHHTHDHNNHVSEKVFKNKLRRSLLDIVNLYKDAGKPLKRLYYRFPYAEYGLSDDYHHLNVIREVSNELFKENCVRFVFWDHDSSDWMKILKPQDIFNNLVSFIQGGPYITYQVKRINGRKRIVKKIIPEYMTQFGGVILLHDIQEKTVTATEMLLKNRKKLGFKVVPLARTKEYQNFSKSCQRNFKL